MYVKILFDVKAKKGLLSGRGFSCLVDGKILFDTGEDPTSLVENMDRMTVSAGELEGVVISHDHWAHTSGLWEILKRNKGLKVYVCPAFSDTFKECVGESGGELIVVNKPLEISDNIFVTGDMVSPYEEETISEQLLVVKGDNGVSVITGCAHRGIVNVLEHTKTTLGTESLYMVFGGFHLDGMKREEIEKIISDLKKIGVIKTGPTSCSGEMARRVFSGQYHDNFVPVKAGHVIHL